MKVWLRNLGVLAAFSLLVASAAHAMLITVSFTANNFVPNTGSTPAPVDPVSGTIVWDAASVNSPINSLTSISLVIDGHTYSLGEIGFENFTNDVFIGGLLNGIRALAPGTDDFFFFWHFATPTPFEFLYASSVHTQTVWISNTFPQVTVTTTPEPTTLALLTLGLLGLAAARRSKARS